MFSHMRTLDVTYSIEYFHPRVLAEIESWPSETLADYARIAELLMEHGPNLRLPHSRAFGGGLFELRPRGKSANGLWCCTHSSRSHSKLLIES